MAIIFTAFLIRYRVFLINTRSTWNSFFNILLSNTLIIINLIRVSNYKNTNLWLFNFLFTVISCIIIVFFVIEGELFNLHLLFCPCFFMVGWRFSLFWDIIDLFILRLKLRFLKRNRFFSFNLNYSFLYLCFSFLNNINIFFYLNFFLKIFLWLFRWNNKFFFLFKWHHLISWKTMCFFFLM